MTSLAFASATVVSGCASSFESTVCAQVIRSQGEPFARFEALPAHDLGNGRVLTATSRTMKQAAGNLVFADDLILTDCRSGEQLTLTSASRNGGGETLVDQRAAARQILNNGAVGHMAQLRSDAVALGIPAATSTGTQETCGCNALYPELRGTKTEYEGPR
ncbi:hypothetical protein [Yoonia sediminilitoris]|nr:hypothetical protein [Yoonia sediminilitoris]